LDVSSIETALWGVGDMFSAGKTNVVAEVSGKNIYSEEEYSTVISVKMFENCAMHSMGSSFKQIILNI